MNPQAEQLWTRPRWQLALLLAGLGMVGPFAIDAYLPAFAGPEGIAQTLGATPLQMQQTLSAYLLAFAVMNLFHGALADSFGRRPVVLGGVALFTLASIGCALSQSITELIVCRALQGLSAGAGMVVARAIIRDMYPPTLAQKVMSQVTIFFGVAPVIAPALGGYVFVAGGWHAVFWGLAVVGALLFCLNWRLLPETLHERQVQPFHPRHLMAGYWGLGSSRRFWLLALSSGIPFNGMFLYVLAAPTFLGEHLGLQPTEYFWFFALSMSGLTLGAWLSGRLAGRIPPQRQIRWGYTVMGVVSVANVALNLLLPPSAAWSMLPVAVFSLGWALMVPVVTLMVLDLAPDRRGLVSSLQMCVGSAANAVVAGVLVPLVMHSALALAFASLGLLLVGWSAWKFDTAHSRPHS
ncbi:MAG: multidrug effflux MFS transporter [Betaproteobacteria bacterium]